LLINYQINCFHFINSLKDVEPQGDILKSTWI